MAAGVSGGLMIVERFLFETSAHRLRDDFDRAMASGESAPVWSVMRDPRGGFCLQARAEALLPAEHVRQFVEALRAWSADRLGLTRVSSPMVQLHPAGSGTPIGEDRSGGRLVYHYFLTHPGTPPIGGGTCLGEEGEVVEPVFNRLALFDSRARHGVAPVGAAGRLALTGTIGEGRPSLSGSLRLDQARPALESALRSFFTENETLIRGLDGLLVIICRIGPDGRLSEWAVRSDRVIGGGEAWPGALARLEAGLRATAFPPAEGESELVLPLSFGIPPAEEENEAPETPPRGTGGDYAILARLAETRPRDARLLNGIVSAALRVGDLRAAADFAARHALLTRGSERLRGEAEPLALSEEHYLTPLKMKHDIDQFRHLLRLGRGWPDLGEVLAAYERALAGCAGRDPDERIPVAEIGEAMVRSLDGRILHLRPTPRLPGSALSESWDRRRAEDTYLEHPLGVMVIDDFLSGPAWRELLEFCQDSTIWFGNRYRNGRLGAFFRDGFNCPLLVQIAEEIRDAFPRIIGHRHPLAQMWGYKYSPIHSSVAPHADFAAVNVNFWITPDEANLDPERGGLIVYDREAPADWEFDDYNKNRGRRITSFISETGAKSFEIPYRANRAVIFNSDLFHATAPCRFGDRYEDRRINVTMLYGRRGEAD